MCAVRAVRAVRAVHAVVACRDGSARASPVRVQQLLSTRCVIQLQSHRSFVGVGARGLAPTKRCGGRTQWDMAECRRGRGGVGGGGDLAGCYKRVNR